jgi:hypothetical protein
MSTENETSNALINEGLENILKTFPYLKSAQNLFENIMSIIPDIMGKKDDISVEYTYNGVGIVLLIVSIVIIDQVKHNTILVPETPEGTIFIVFLIFLLINVIYTGYLYVNDVHLKTGRGMTGLPLYIKTIIHTIPLYIIVFVFSLIVFILSNIFGWITMFINGILEILYFITNAISKILEDKDESKVLYKYGGLYAVIFGIIIILYYAALDPKALSGKTFTYTMSIILPLIIIFAYVNPFSNKQGSAMSMLIIGVIATFFIAIFYFYSKSNSATFELVNYLVMILIFMLSIVGLSIFFYIMGNYLKSLSGWTGFMVYLMFYIPCLFIDFVKYILNEFKMTADPIFVILIVEIILIVLYVYLPWILKTINTSKSNDLLPGSAFLDIKQNIGNSEMNKMPKLLQGIDNSDSEPVYNQNYAYSMWIFLNPQGSEYSGYKGETQIFNYGEGKPKVSYNVDSTTGESKYRVYFTNSVMQKGYYEFSMPAQKWNNLVMNFTSTQADLFVNGQLENTYLFEGNPPNYLPTDYVTIGQDKGLDGAICNVVYYPKNISLIEIANNYNLLAMRNPPTYR